MVIFVAMLLGVGAAAVVTSAQEGWIICIHLLCPSAIDV